MAVPADDRKGGNTGDTVNKKGLRDTGRGKGMGRGYNGGSCLGLPVLTADSAFINKCESNKVESHLLSLQ